MAKMILKLENDINGKKILTIGYKSDEDALPQEHEVEHGLLVNKLLEGDNKTITRKADGSIIEIENKEVEAEKVGIKQ